jgi:hypothetical protein
VISKVTSASWHGSSEHASGSPGVVRNREIE